jgi:transposase-like protein
VEEVPDPQVPERAKRRSYSAEYKAEILAEYDRLDRDGRGALLRREGLYSSLISEWRKQAAKGALAALGKSEGTQRPTRWSGRTPGCRPRSPGCRPNWRPRGG